MFREAAAASDCIARQAEAESSALAGLGRALAGSPPRLVVTVARGSSDHAATYAKYLIETMTGTPVASFAPSIGSVYRAPTLLAGSLCLAISQSGRSPDIIAAVRNAREGGAIVAALVNDPGSPLAAEAHHVLPLHAAPETAVAATKSFLASLAMVARIAQAWTGDESLAAALATLPEAMRRAWALDWSAAAGAAPARRSQFVIARGLGLAVAHEAALKLKETCRIHAEAYSAAEVLHGPAAIIRPGFPVLALAQDDDTAPSVAATASRLASLGARVSIAGARADGCGELPSLQCDPRVQPILLAQTFYRLANHWALAAGENPDQPPHLSKVTETT